MQPSADEFASFLEGFSFSPLQTPVIANITGRPYDEGNAEQIKESLVKQIAGSVQWTESIRYLKGLGEMEFEELGPGNVLTKLIKQID